MTDNYRQIDSFLAGSKNDIRSLGTDLYIIRNASGTSQPYPIKSDMLVCSIATSGNISGRLNLNHYTQNVGQLCLTLPGAIIEQTHCSPDYRCLCILMSEDFINSLNLKYDMLTHMAIQRNPVLKLNDQQQEAALTFGEMAYSVLGTSNPFKREIIQHLTCAYIYGLGYYLYERDESQKLTNDEQTMLRFLQIVRQHFRRERRVQFYADMLHLSAGYLSILIKKTSGRTATQWIDEHVILEAKVMLKSGGMSVQQVSNELNFPSQSFFGKYFKRHTGMSPKEYKSK